MGDLIGTNHPHNTYTDNSLISLAFAECVLQKDILLDRNIYSKVLTIQALLGLAKIH
jgi:hypothetical protein